jgi:hypothetical protein
MSDLIAQIQMAQRDAGERAVIAHLQRTMGKLKLEAEKPAPALGQVLQLPGAFRSVDADRNRLRAAQAEAVMPLIGPLLDAWACCSQACREELPELDKHLRQLNRAMEDAGA